MHNERMRTFFVAAGVTLLSGCASLSNLQTADTLGRGNFQVGVEPGVLSAGSYGVPLGNGNPAWLPHVDVAARFGVSEGVDLGLRAGLSFLELQGKFLFTRPGDRHLAVSFAPTAGGLLINTSTSSIGGVLNVALPVLIGIKTAGGSELVIGPRLQNLVLLPSAGSAVYGVGAGLSLGFAVRFTDNFALLPEVSAVLPVYGAAAFASQFQSSSLTGSGLFFLQFKLGVLVGRFRPVAINAPPPPPAIPPAGQVPISNPPLP
jgi:hypothetical protein